MYNKAIDAHKCRSSYCSNSPYNITKTKCTSLKNGPNENVSRRAVFRGLSLGLPFLYYNHLFQEQHPAAIASVLTQDRVLNIFCDSDKKEKIFNQLESRVTQFELNNGLRFVVLKRDRVPIISFNTYVNVGAYDEADGKTGIAHFLEHLMFKGTQKLGTVNFEQESKLLGLIDDVYCELREAKSNGLNTRAKSLEYKFKNLTEKAYSLILPNAYGSLMEREGAVGLNAATSHDSTNYYVSLPSNKTELWFASESDRLKNPVFRGFYSEKKVVLEERRLRVEGSGYGKFIEEFNNIALSNNYKRPALGYQKDIQSLSRPEVKDFYDLYYNPKNIVISIVGDIDPEGALKLAKRYFSDWEPSAKALINNLPASPEPLPCPEIVSSGKVKEYVAFGYPGPLCNLSYYRASLLGAEGEILACISNILSGGRTSRLVEGLVKSGKALYVYVDPAYPAIKHPGLLQISAKPTSGMSLENLEKEIKNELNRLSNEKIKDTELSKIKRSLKAATYAISKSNSSMASLLSATVALKGNWKCLIEDLNFRNNITPSLITDIADRTFTDSNCFKSFIFPTDNN